MECRQILQQYWGYPDFRGIQKDIIESICAGHDTLGLMPTGGGKSITFQVPALAMDGVCIVITPLIALMKDQVDHLLKLGIKAASIYSGMTRPEIIKVLENAVFGGVKILYVSPERLSSELFQAKLKHMKVSFITVDEAHCISQWGYDFRPSYLNIADIRKLKPDVSILALTATATTKVVDDIQEKLGFKEKNVFRMSFERKNLTYVVRLASDKDQQLIHILNSVKGCAIVYVRSRKRTKEIAQMLNDNDIKATYYHAGLEHYTKDLRQKEWQNDKTRVIVATNAFGMGIDKPNVRIVVHIDCPDSIEAYFQEAGRAGRDSKKAYAVLLYNDGDCRKLHKRITDNFPEKEYVRKVYDSLAYFYQIGVGSGIGHTFAFDIGKFCHNFGLSMILVDSSLRILERAGYIIYENDPKNSARLIFLLSRNQLYILENITSNEDKIITTLLRLYGGLFNDYTYIDEGLIAQKSGLTQQQVYLILKNLSMKRIIHFIPQRKTPYISYSKNRDDGERIIISKSVYEDRKIEFEKRIDAIIKYATNDSVCRSRQLLRYFGETDSNDCELCDVCLEHNTDQASEDRISLPKKRILEMLKDGKKHHITELNEMDIPDRQLDEALEFLINEEYIINDCGYIMLKQK
ncbi:ATP-dependent DNA helicase RecQ [Prevotella herbatica]|uniref:ATP-dependent DNA helicase RecQ n=1 Tax=Prevotella herbatica TaxID=2801997 RepID=A0ABM7P1W0_9BACT|nr:ATP-dependent DNA helicase RecQ [Prevotella herbatica]BCS86723.1 ATP-dependent DNA helicase RecQ [Prevotella herbatica]